MESATENRVIWGAAQTAQRFQTERLERVPPKRFYCAVKRGFDLCASLVAMVVLLIPMLLIALLIVLDSPGAPIYAQTRLGKAEKPFTLYKFRSMISGAEENGLRWAEVDDPRVTRIGRWLRKTRLDELPQLVNILLGQMSIVGPRPERPEFYDLFDTYIDGFRQRMLVTPGLTGLAQVSGGYELLPEEKIRYDIEYIKKRSAWMDLKCILKTILIVFTSKGAR